MAASDCRWRTIGGRKVCITSGHGHAPTQLPPIDDGPAAFLVRRELEEADLPQLHYDGLTRIGFSENEYIRAEVGDGRIVEAYGAYYPSTRQILLTSNANRGGSNIAVFGGATVLHEMGHHVHMAKLTDAAAKQWAEISNNGQNARISAYARTNRGEHFAEAYREYSRRGTHRARLKNLEPDAYKFMQGLMRPESPSVLSSGAHSTDGKRYAE